LSETAFWPFDIICIFSNGSHLGYRMELPDTILKGDHLRTIQAKFGWNWPSGLYPRWPPLLKIEITSNGQNCCIWSHYGLKFELYKYNYELFNILYSGFSYELLAFADFDRLCKLRINCTLWTNGSWTPLTPGLHWYNFESSWSISVLHQISLHWHYLFWRF
jgi:hypothetical protein